MNERNFPLFPGTERYRVIEQLGSGGMGVVYEAEDRERGIPVALKTYKYIDANSLYRFKMEFRSLADLSHPNLVTLYDLVIEDEVCFYTMELVRGEDLVSYCTSMSREKGHRFDERRLRESLTQLAQGIRALHEGGKVHRDIKPSNVLVTPEGRVVVLDFGLVITASNELTMTEEMGVAGTAPYMAPEQALSESETTWAADLYSLGVVLYVTLTGELPFEGSSLEILQSKQHLDPPPPRATNPAVPDDLNQLCLELMNRNPHSRPSLAEVIKRLIRPGEPASPSGLTSVMEEPERGRFIGRETELRALVAQFEQTVQGGLALSMIRGESGIGKSALARAFIEQIRADHPDVVVLRGRCYERENVPYKAIDGLIDNLSRYWRSLDLEIATYILPQGADLLARLFPVLLRVHEVARAPGKNRTIEDPRDLRNRGILALRELFKRLSTVHRVVIFLDDLQWVDQGTVTLLREVLRKPDPPSIHLLMASRHPSERSTPLDELLDAHSDVAELLELAPLTEMQAKRLVGELTASLQEELVSRVARDSGGSPFFIELLAGTLAEEANRSDSLHVEELLRNRLNALPSEARVLLEILAVGAEPLDPLFVARAAGLDQGTAARMLRFLFARRFISQATGYEKERIEVYHDRIRKGVLEALTDEQRRAKHRTLAGVLEGAGEEWYTGCVWHLQHCGELEKAASYARRVADHADRALSFERAAQFYGLCLSLIDHPPQEAGELKIKQGDALANHGRGKEAARIYLEAAALVTPDASIRCQEKAAYCLFTSGHIDEGYKIHEPVLKAHGLIMPKTRRGMIRTLIVQRILLTLLWPKKQTDTRDKSEVDPQLLEKIDAYWTAATSMFSVDSIRAGCFLARHFRLALKARETNRLALAVLLDTMNLAAFGRSDKKVTRGLALVRQLLSKTTHPYVQSYYTFVLGQIASLQGRWTDAVDYFDRASHLFRTQCTGVESERVVGDFCTNIVLFYLGELKEIHRRVQQGTVLAQQRGNLYELTMPYCSPSAAVWLARDEVGFATDKMHEMLGRWSQAGFHFQHFHALIAEAHIALYARRADEALAILQTRPRQIKAAGFDRMKFGRIMLMDLEARCTLAAAAGPQPASRLLKRVSVLAKRLKKEKQSWAVGMSWLISAQLAALRDQGDEAVRCFDTARKAFESCQMALYAAAARYGEGCLLGGEEGQALIASAHDYLTTQEVKNHEAFLYLFVPGVMGK